MFKFDNNMKKILITTFASIIVAIASYSIMYITNFTQYEKEISNKLYMIGKEQKDSIERVINSTIGEISFISNLSGIKNMDKKDIVSIFSYLTSTKKMYSNILLIDIKGNLLYGYSDDLQLIYQNLNYEKSITAKSIIFALNQKGNEYYVEVYSPVIRNNGDVVGVIYIKIGFDEIKEIVKNLRKEDGLESYIVNKEGVMMTESKSILDAVGKVKVNLQKLKLNVDYSETSSYEDYSGKEVYGRYFPIEGTDWTLVIESDYKQNILKQEKSKMIGEIAVVLQGLFVFIIQLYARKKFNIDINDEE